MGYLRGESIHRLCSLVVEKEPYDDVENNEISVKGSHFFLTDSKTSFRAHMQRVVDS